MKFPVRLGLFSLALFIDASGILSLPYIGGQPLLFVSLSVCYGLRGNFLSGGGWGFGGGTALGLIFSDPIIGVLAMAGLLAGGVPSALRGLFYWERWGGQLMLGSLGGALFGLTRLGMIGLKGDIGEISGEAVMRMVLEAVLSGAVTPFLYSAIRRIKSAQ